MTVPLARSSPATAIAAGARARPGADTSWITATLRPAGSFGRDDVVRIRGLLDVLSVNASMVVIDLESAHVRSGRVAAAFEQAAQELECRGGCLVCLNADPATRALLAAAGHHLVIVDQASESVDHALSIDQSPGAEPGPREDHARGRSALSGPV